MAEVRGPIVIAGRSARPPSFMKPRTAEPDANTTAGMGVPTIDGLGPIGGNDHSPAEYLEVDSIVPRTTLLAGLLLAIARDPVIAGWRKGS